MQNSWDRQAYITEFDWLGIVTAEMKLKKNVYVTEEKGTECLKETLIIAYRFYLVQSFIGWPDPFKTNDLLATRSGVLFFRARLR